VGGRKLEEKKKKSQQRDYLPEDGQVRSAKKKIPRPCPQGHWVAEKNACEPTE